jgi:hypothetical protein
MDAMQSFVVGNPTGARCNCDITNLSRLERAGEKPIHKVTIRQTDGHG